jgi:DNA-binding beta-propeller fold protein YncE
MHEMETRVPRRAWWRRWLARTAGAAALVLAACAPPATAAGRPPAGIVYVANGLEGTVTRLDGASGRRLGPPLPAGRAPWRIAAGPGGRLLVLASTGHSALTHLAPGGRPGEGWTTRPVPLESGATAALLAGTGRGRAALSYHVAAPAGSAASWSCRLLLLDVADGAVEATLDPCRSGEVVAGLAFGDGPGGPTAYLSLWRAAVRDAGAAPGDGRVRAVDLASGAAVAEAPLVGVPGPLAVATAPDAAGSRVFGVEGQYGAGLAAEDGPADRWLLRWFDPLTLGPQGAVALPAPPRALAAAADGDAYLLADPGGLARTSQLVRVDVHRAAVHSLGTVPGSGAGGLTVVGDRLYVPNPEGDAVTVIDRRTGASLPTAGSGRGPVGVAFAGGGIAGGVGVGKRSTTTTVRPR